MAAKKVDLLIVVLDIVRGEGSSKILQSYAKAWVKCGKKIYEGKGVKESRVHYEHFHSLECYIIRCCDDKPNNELSRIR